MINDEFYMFLAVKKAWEFQILTYPNPAVGCAILDASGRLLSVAAHKKAGFLHAEPIAALLALCQKSESFLNGFLREYNTAFGTKFTNIAELESADLEPKFTYEFILKNHGDALKGGTVYVTLEPCSHCGKTPPCANLLKELKFGEAVIARSDENVVASGGMQILKDSGVKIKFGILKDEADKLISPFLSWQNKNFSFFKLALSANGVAVGAKNSITNGLSRTLVHKLRSVADLLAIGGNTVRIDRPTLDSRLVGGKNPNVFIYSRAKEFDVNIPLFSVANRSVKISNNLDEINSKLTMFEGGEGLLNAVKDYVDAFLIFRSSDFTQNDNLRTDLCLKPLFIGTLGDDTYGWYVKNNF